MLRFQKLQLFVLPLFILVLFNLLPTIFLDGHSLLSDRLSHYIEVAIVMQHVLIYFLEEVRIRSKSKALLLLFFGRLLYLLNTWSWLFILLRNGVLTLLELLVISRFYHLDIIQFFLKLCKHHFELCFLFLKVFPIKVQLLLSFSCNLLIKSNSCRGCRYQNSFVIDSSLHTAILRVEFLMFMCGC